MRIFPAMMFIFLSILLVGVLAIIAFVGYRSYVQHWRNINYTETNPDRGHFSKLNTNADDNNTLDEDGLESGGGGGGGGGGSVLPGGSGTGDTLTLEEDGAEEIN